MTQLTFEQIKKRVGRETLYYNTADSTWKTNRDVTEGDIEEMINDLYRYDLFEAIAKRYPQYYTQIGHADSWVATGTAGASLTGSTLTATTSIFNNSMVGLKVYNETEDETTEITGYTSGTTVTVKDSDIANWSGDTIYVLGEIFGFGGDTTDIYVIEHVGLKYTSGDQYYKVAEQRDYEDIYQEGYEVGSKVKPYYYETTITEDGALKDAIGIVPKFEKKLEDAIEMRYVVRPDALSATTDVPKLPSCKALIEGVIANVYRQQKDMKTAREYEQRFQLETRKMLSRFTPKKNAQIRIPRRYGNIFERNI